MNETLKYYNKNAKSFIQGTADVEFHEIQDRFLSRLPQGAMVLDFGCGSGRDSRYFINKGFQVEAIDGSEELCKMAADYIGIPVKQMLFTELNEKEKYDGIWACSSILHLPKTELKEVLRKMSDALKENGIIYTSFKYGCFEGMRNGRYFTDFTSEGFQSYIKEMDGLSIVEEWITGDVRPGRGDEKWLNLIIQKNMTK